MMNSLGKSLEILQWVLGRIDRREKEEKKLKEEINALPDDKPDAGRLHRIWERINRL